jgi:hypothetical protein
MNRAINILLLFFSFPAMTFTIYVAFDIPLDFLKSTAGTLPYRFTIFMVFALILLVLVLRRTAGRWVGISMSRLPERFLWSVPIGKERRKQVRMYLWIEMIVAAAFTLTTLGLTYEAWPLALVYGLLFLDQLVFLVVAPKWFRVGITHQAVLISDRELRVLYFSGLRRVEKHQQTIYFEYLEDLQLFFPENCIDAGNYTGFREALESKVNRDKVFFSEAFKELV